MTMKRKKAAAPAICRRLTELEQACEELTPQEIMGELHGFDTGVAYYDEDQHTVVHDRFTRLGLAHHLAMWRLIEEVNA